MTDYKNSKWALEIIELQKEEGSWGYFHSLSNPSENNRITTEQAIRRLAILGYTIKDEPIGKAVAYMQDCLAGKKVIPDRREKLHNWDIFTALMLATWIRRFTKDDDKANQVGKKWAEIINYAFLDGGYDHNRYVEIYQKIHGIPPRGGRLVDVVNFYHVSLVADLLPAQTALAFLDYILQKETGIYYIYDKPLSILPPVFQSIEASRYLAAIELLAEYKHPGCKEKLNFVVEWLNRNKEPGGDWDMGPKVKNGIHFPLSNSWRQKELRIKDCTYRITNLIKNLGN